VWWQPWARPPGRARVRLHGARGRAGRVAAGFGQHATVGPGTGAAWGQTWPRRPVYPCTGGARPGRQVGAGRDSSAAPSARPTGHVSAGLLRVGSPGGASWRNRPSRIVASYPGAARARRARRSSESPPSSPSPNRAASRPGLGRGGLARRGTGDPAHRTRARHPPGLSEPRKPRRRAACFPGSQQPRKRRAAPPAPDRGRRARALGRLMGTRRPALWTAPRCGHRRRGAAGGPAAGPWSPRSGAGLGVASGQRRTAASRAVGNQYAPRPPWGESGNGVALNARIGPATPASSSVSGHGARRLRGHSRLPSPPLPGARYRRGRVAGRAAPITGASRPRWAADWD
jgi:hypothetical protein